MMKPVVAIGLAILLGATQPSTAQEVARDPGQTATSRYFPKPVDFWNAGLNLSRPTPVEEPAAPGAGRIALRENVWAQPIRTPDGSWMVYVPPKQVLDFLESPSEDTAKAYLAWKAEQTAKLQKAMTLLATLKASPETDKAQASASFKPAAPEFAFRITYFKKPSCPHCVSQDAVLADWLPKRPAAKLDVLLPGQRPELWQAYEVRGTPTLHVQAEDQEEVLVGLQSSQALEAALARLSHRLSDSKTLRKESSR